MFSSSHFAPDHFGEHFKITGQVIIIPDEGGGGSKGMVVDYAELRRLNLRKEDEEILEFIVAWVMSRQ